ncbi:MAG: outer membrane protein assembly factor BamE [Methylomonas sp.]|nr:outer membrane protein assembly factor BamE [Methylomonas sp.]PPD19456.1 MAG: hypothetical protein CTY23_11825 [Methylomonas sp.]PPD24971.1 MAG: hypothetical protein CTY22_10065 [Methylomonas sp.]PPD34148.1 MAG: hypothetical protein CTY21_10045 [Methylomonas sp.]PPD38004.1 MAG: hypothetical protein CTY17_10145 [Methylomonas sp.]
MNEIASTSNIRNTSAAMVLIAILASTTLSGCFTVGQEFAASRVPEIKIGETRKQDISEMFGQPWRTGLEDGHPTWTYGIYRYAVFGATDTQDLLIRFDNQGVVRSYSFNSTRVKQPITRLE